MLRFLKEIRKNYVITSKFRKYLLYAIGEIVLVVIGILIALQINTWRESRNNDELKNEYIKSFRRDLKSDISFLKSQITSMEEDIEYQKKILNRIASDYATKDTLVKIMRDDFNPYFSPSNTLNTTTYERIHTNGHISLLDSTLVNKIMKHHEYQMQVVVNLESNLGAMFDTYVQILEKFPNMPQLDAFGKPLFTKKRGKLEIEFWQNVDQNELYGSLIGLVINKLQQERIVVGLRKFLLNRTTELLVTLDKY